MFASCQKYALSAPIHDRVIPTNTVFVDPQLPENPFASLEIGTFAWQTAWMKPSLSSTARFAAGLVALLAVASVMMRFFYDLGIGEETAAETVWSLARFFTLLTNTLVALTFAYVAVQKKAPRPGWPAALTLSIVLVGVVYHLLLAHLVNFTGLGWYADHGLHTLTPIACLVWWIFFAPKRTLEFRDLPMFVLWPCVYMAYALARGAQDGTYPYPFVDLNELAPAAVAVNLAGLMGVMLVGGFVAILIGRFADR